MKIAIFAPYGNANVVFERELEIAQQHIVEGDEVTVLVCGGEYCTCDINPDHWLARCVGCVSRRNCGLKLLSAPVKTITLLDFQPSDRQELKKLLEANYDLDKLKALVVENFDIGLGVLSSLITHTREPKPDLVRHQSLVKKNIQICWETYQGALNFFTMQKFDRAYIWNGRLGIDRAVLRAAQSCGVEFTTHEYGSSFESYGLFPNSTPHDIEYYTRQIREVWNANKDADSQLAIAHQFFISRAAGKPVEWHTSFIAAQVAGTLPHNWDTSKKNLAVFVSSEDEFEAVGGAWGNKPFASQAWAIQKIANALQPHADNFHLYVRMHPNLSSLRNSQITDMARVSAPWLTVIPAESQVSSYDLLRSAEKAISFGSTMGIEATYWRIPSVLFGPSIYSGLDGTYNTDTFADLTNLLFQPLPPKDQEAALMYGYYFSTFGKRYLHYKPTSFQDGLFNGQKVQASYFLRLGKQLANRPLALCRRILRKPPPRGWTY